MNKELDKKIEEKLNAGREYRRTQVIEVRALQDNEEESYIVEGYATTFNEPYLLYDTGDYKVYEQVDARAFEGCDMSDVIMQFDHKGRVYARLSNGTLELIVDQRGLKVIADLGGTERGRELYEEIKGGYVNKMSFGFIVAEDTREIREDTEHTTVMRTITKISKLYDVSAVSIPANDTTDISARAYCEGVIAEAEAERLLAEQRKAQIKRIEILSMI